MHQIKHIFPILLAIWMLAPWPPAHADMPLEVIQLQHRPAADLLPILRPMLVEGASMTGTGFQLIVRTTPENLAELRGILATLDSAPKQLLVTVKQVADRSELGSDVSIGANVHIGEHGRVILPGGGVTGRDNVTLRARGTAARGDDADTQSVRVLEGGDAYIQIGQSVPVLERTEHYNGYSSYTQDNIAYKDVTRGFYVRPQLNGDTVTVEINPHRDRLSTTQGGAIDTQSMHTTVTGRLGEWLEIGGIDSESSSEDSGIVYRTGSREEDRRRVFMRVEVVE
jgi:hypothetical protein